MSQALSSPPKRNRMLILIAFFLILFGAIFAYVGWYSIKLERQYETNGVKVQGTVTGKKIEESWQTDSQTKQRTKTTTYYLEYNFKPNEGSNVDSRSSVDSERYNNANSGDKIEIQYLPGDINNNRIAGSSDYVFGYAFMAFGTLLIIPGLCLFSYDFKKRKLAKRLFSEGMLTEATIKHIGPGNLEINNVHQWRIEYSFKDIRGQEQSAFSEHFAPERAQGLKAGDKGRVRYDRNNSKLSMWVWER